MPPLDKLGAPSTATGSLGLHAGLLLTEPLRDDVGGTPAEAATLSVGASRAGVIETAGDLDWHAVTLEAGRTYVLRLDAVGALDPYIEFRGPAGQLIAADDDAGPGLNSLLTVTAGVSGVHYVVARGFGPSTGDYVLSVEAPVAPPGGDDFGATASTAGRFGADGSASGVIEAAGDRDWFAVTLEAGRTYQVDLTGGGLRDPYLTIFGPDGSVVAFDDDSGPGFDARTTFIAPTAGVYHVEARGFSASTGDYRVTVAPRATATSTGNDGVTASIAPVRAVSLTGDRRLDALIGGAAWQGSEITYSFVNSNSVWNYNQPDQGSLVSVSGETAEQVRAAFRAIAQVINVTFRETTDGPGGAGDIRIAIDSSLPGSGTAGYAYFPSADGIGGDVQMRPVRSAADAAPGGAWFSTLLHEIGHALGLKHPFDARGASPVTLPLAEDTSDNTIMSYTDVGAEAITPQVYDILALQALYGPNLVATGGADVWRPGVGKQAIYDAGGIDLLDFSATGGAAAIDLAPGARSRTTSLGTAANDRNTVFIVDNTVIENAQGGSGADTILGNAAANDLDGGGGADTLNGGLGADTLTGGAGADSLTGGAGDDRLVGGDGLDAARIAATAAEARVTIAGGSATIVSAEGADALVGVERLELADRTLRLDLDAAAGQAYRIYRAAFDREPDAAGLGYWIRQMDAGAGLAQVATSFIASQEFATLYGPPQQVNNAAFVNLLYRNVLDRAPDADGLAYWTRELDSGVAAGNVLAGFSESRENMAAVLSQIASGIWLV